ncbi:MAG: serine/threonine protein kinase [Myxococcales bacterium]|nr:serine/threonine protein kinase [Myxococcales bacterium]
MPCPRGDLRFVLVYRAAMEDAWVGRQLDRFSIARLIGRGAMADVYQATDPLATDGGPVAIKILRQSLAKRQEIAERFRREAEAQAKVTHRNVAALKGSGTTPSGQPYLVLELLRGRSLRGLIKTSGPIETGRALAYILQALRGLAAVHAEGILHRDLKPANIMLEDANGLSAGARAGTGGGGASAGSGAIERVVLIDFGFAVLEGATKLTQVGHVVGSLQYLAPERLRGEVGDARSDLYSLGIVLFEALAGVPPYVADSDFDLVDQQLHAPVPEVSSRNPRAKVSEPLLELIDRALAKKPEHRFRSAEDMAASVVALQNGVFRAK